ncbi:hypothetical protein IX84_03000 [Phaeodactylibacter xiamenensis]|uniref:Uncharacterized protein n=1 Tax=Phaeodactylibacter xiamenensis TaxID=1524460 RepID=A0A098SEE3_9BACT|nr:hypothetical protein IX84_03000 [Phaeodactylibacter xiamenensis]
MLHGNQIRRRGRIAVPEVVVDKKCVVALKLNKKGPAWRPARQLGSLGAAAAGGLASLPL